MLVALITLCFVQSVWCHARLMEPPSRSSMWRHGYDTPKNYDDDGLYCGGMKVSRIIHCTLFYSDILIQFSHKSLLALQWENYFDTEGYANFTLYSVESKWWKMWVCGDPWHLEVPRPNENGGKYGNGIIVRTYKPGQEVTQDCLDQNVLTIINSTSTQYHVGNHGRSRVTLALQLPKGFTCKYCVFQWTYTAGCGIQETFKACADISINERTLSDVKPTTATPSTTVKPTKASRRPTFTKPTKINRLPLVGHTKPTVSAFPNRNKDKNKKPVQKPNIIRGETFQEALDRIRKDPRLSKWAYLDIYISYKGYISKIYDNNNV
ncbi:hypothetical protein CEXT_120601 [Caerostris extrusa]|uniref:Chitin-binding type-4 domain-containing protein n=1 Tax=Caerostris extrusa TaxID=172846 RepID=A0AAV4WZ20_CAEEX|nr:hypothetical protein CEXT_120601 [Caerostris extrusa]